MLLVEDNELDVHLIEVVLSNFDSHPAGQFVFNWVQSLSEAFEWLEHNTVDVVLLDLNLPDGIGLQSLSSLRSVVRDKPIVVLTGQNDPGLGTQAIRNGAQDYLCKNEATGEHLSRALHFALERFKRQRVEFELAGAGFIQRMILSQELPTIPGWQLAARCEPAEAVAGDFYDFIPLDDSTLVMVLGDVSGKGLGPALLMAETRGMIRSVLEWEHDPGAVLTKVNSLIAHDCIRGAFVTTFLGVLTPENRTITYATAGHEGFLLDRFGRPKARLAEPRSTSGYPRRSPLSLGQARANARNRFGLFLHRWHHRRLSAVVESVLWHEPRV